MDDKERGIIKGLVKIDTEKRIDWNAIRGEYISGTGSYRTLAAKYGISKDGIAKKAKAEDWSRQRATASDRSTTEVIQKTAEIAADNATLAANIKRKGLLILERLFDAYDADGTEHRETGDGKTDIKRIRDLTAAYKDLTDDIPKAANDRDDPLMELLKRINDECV